VSIGGTGNCHSIATVLQSRLILQGHQGLVDLGQVVRFASACQKSVRALLWAFGSLAFTHVHQRFL
jgi:hypothetical protein